MIVPNHFENLNVLHEGTMPVRSYYIPASIFRDDLVENREKSDRFQLLNGDWKFCYTKSIHEFDEAFYLETFDASSWDLLPVPSIWQNHGFDCHQYTNWRYPFPFDPPYLPHENPCGAYLHRFDYVWEDNAPNVYLNFEGVDSCFFVWLNGEYIGYSQVSHSTSEFDVTKAIREGSNLLAVLVVKWCDGSYFEDQDKFRATGIFRDVYLLKRPNDCIFDYYTTTVNRKDNSNVNIRFKCLGDVQTIGVNILDATGETIATSNACECTDDEYTHQVDFVVHNPILWNPEHPYLYTVVFNTLNETITDRIGLRTVSVTRNQVLINDVPIKFRGVNRHDSDPFTGPVIGIDQIKLDLRLIKEHNFNAIRTSHYPNAPMFYQLCDQYGFLVVDEADLEAHGVLGRYRSNDDAKVIRKQLWNEPFMENPEYLEPIKDRVMRCVHRDKNRPCVIAWSAGNESGYGYCLETTLRELRKFDSTRLLHYEGAKYTNPIRKYDYSNLDLYSAMYTSKEVLQQYVESNPDKPYLICEYAHAMGNGPGDLEDYWEMFQAHDALCGGFVWEWCDHAVFAGYTEAGKAKFLYGGDHQESTHDSNFCMDGLVYPDRRPHTGLLEYKNVNRPVRVEKYDPVSGQLYLHNYMDFSELSRNVYLTYELNCDGTVIATGQIEGLPHVLPHCSGIVPLRLDIPTAGRCYLKIEYRLNHNVPLLNKGFCLGFDEVQIANCDSRNQVAVSLMQKEIHDERTLTVEEVGRRIVITGRTFSYTYDKFTAAFEKMIVNGSNFLDKGIQYNIWRAPTDNDRNLKRRWFAAHYDTATIRVYKTSYLLDENCVRIHSFASLAAIGMQKFIEFDVDWCVCNSGTVDVVIHARRDVDFPELPRFGLRLFLPKNYETVRYYGLGPSESYVDKRHAAYHGLFNTTVTDLYEDYIRPQENGAHYDCDYVVLENDVNRIVIVGNEKFSFTASHYTQEELMNKSHNYELEESCSTVLCIDYKQNGIGSNSCGPALIDKYCFADSEFVFSVRILSDQNCTCI